MHDALPVRYGLATHHFHLRGSQKGSWCSTFNSPWMSSRPPGPMGVPVTAQRWVLCRRPAMTATLLRPVPTICASSSTTLHQLHKHRGVSCFEHLFWPDRKNTHNKKLFWQKRVAVIEQAYESWFLGNEALPDVSLHQPHVHNMQRAQCTENYLDKVTVTATLQIHATSMMQDEWKQAHHLPALYVHDKLINLVQGAHHMKFSACWGHSRLTLLHCTSASAHAQQTVSRTHITACPIASNGRRPSSGTCS